LALKDSKLESNEQEDSNSTEMTNSAINESIPQQFLDELIEAASALNVNVISDPITYNEALNSPNSVK
jgi:major membrane immunogen (membrane-anchored lipoprotein)